jgi:sigma-B regulation protein RsbU (phosphoserine phosphatase)
VCQPGSLLGEMSLFSLDRAHTASVRAMGPVCLLEMTRREFETLLERQPLLAIGIVRLLSQKLEESENVTIRDLRAKNLQLTLAYQELQAALAQLVEKEKIERELEIARQIQRSILPQDVPHLAGYDFGVLMIPARAVGGDFYDFIPLCDGRLGIVIGDVCDKGVPAALFMTLTYSLIRAEAQRCLSPVETLENANRHLLGMNASDLFVTLVYGILDADRGEYHYARAGHNIPLVLDRAGQGVVPPVKVGQPLGLSDPFVIDEVKVTLPPGGLLLVYSDGITETSDRQGADFGLGGLHSILAAYRDLPAQAICAQIWEAVKAFGEGMPRQDDFTALVVKRTL